MLAEDILVSCNKESKLEALRSGNGHLAYALVDGGVGRKRRDLIPGELRQPHLALLRAELRAREADFPLGRDGLGLDLSHQLPRDRWLVSALTHERRRETLLTFWSASLDNDILTKTWYLG